MKCVHIAWREHGGEILGFLHHRTGDGHDAADLLQEVFLRAVNQGSSFCQVENRRAWLFHVARNLLVDCLRLNKAQVPLPDDLQANEELGPAPVEQLSQCLPRVLSELTPQDREAIIFCDINGSTQQAFATHLGLMLPAAKARVQRARRRLREQLVKSCQVTFDEAGQVCCFIPRPPL